MKKLALLLALCLSLCLLTACGGNKNAIVVKNDESKGTVTLATKKGEPVTEVTAPMDVVVTIKVKGSNACSEILVDGETVALPESDQITLSVDSGFKIETKYFDPYAVRAENPEMATRRDIVEESMRAYTATLFYYDIDLPHTHTDGNTAYSIKGDMIYRGVPYTNGNTSFEGYMMYVTDVDEDGVHYIDTSRFAQPGWGMMLGGSCADAVYWSWSEISDSITVRWASEATTARGLVKVGPWTYHNKNEYMDTHAIIKENGDEIMLESYALTLKGDGLAFQVKNAGAHLAMVAENHVARRPDGTIDPGNSYVIYHDTNGWYHDVEATTATGDVILVRTATTVDGKMTYSQLLSNGYLPVTCPELIYPENEIGEVVVTDSQAGNLSVDTLFDGIIECNYYMDYHTMTITDKDGNVVQQAVRHSYEFNHKDFDIWAFKKSVHDDQESYVEHYPDEECINIRNLEPGQYHCKLTSHISTGDEIVVRDFDFTI
ncbi:MAG: hypothetical protein J6K84_03655 [Oscillospiraceae bacterium]|nr:hypothetical protein [Oscillospiraceae bacterium]